MKTLLLMRHAKSSWKERPMTEKDRPLSKRGIKNATQMGSVFLENELIPQLVLCSSVKRARQTAELVLKACDYAGEVIFLDKLFRAEPKVILDALRLLPDAVERVLVVGHNPGMESMLQMLARQIVPLPVASVAHISLNANTWKSIGFEHSADLIQLWEPKGMK